MTVRSVMPQGTIHSKSRKSGRDVQREAMRGDALRDVDADGGNLLFGNASSGECPYAGALADALSHDTEVAAGSDEGFFEQANEVHRTEVRAFLSREIAAQVDDGIADELAGAVIGDVAAAVNLVEFDALSHKEFVGREDVAAVRVATEGEDRRMLEHQERIADGGPALRAAMTFCWRARPSA